MWPITLNSESTARSWTQARTHLNHKLQKLDFKSQTPNPNPPNRKQVQVEDLTECSKDVGLGMWPIFAIGVVSPGLFHSSSSSSSSFSSLLSSLELSGTQSQ
jgi:hypothetical protein